MSDMAFKAFGIFCFSIICFGFGTVIAGEILSSGAGDSDSVFFVAWGIGTIVFGIAMAVAYGR